MYMHFYNMESIKRTLQILGIALCGTVNATAYVNMAYTKVDGVCLLYTSDAADD